MGARQLCEDTGYRSVATDGLEDGEGKGSAGWIGVGGERNERNEEVFLLLLLLLLCLVCRGFVVA